MDNIKDVNLRNVRTKVTVKADVSVVKVYTELIHKNCVVTFPAKYSHWKAIVSPIIGKLTGNSNTSPGIPPAYFIISLYTNKNPGSENKC